MHVYLLSTCFAIFSGIEHALGGVFCVRKLGVRAVTLTVGRSTGAVTPVNTVEV
mgnify:CR=1 FL=1